MARLTSSIAWIGFLAGTLAGRVASAQASRPDVFRAVLDSVYTAVARGDSIALGRWLAPGLVWTTGTGSEATRAQIMTIGSRPQTPIPRYDVDSVRVERIGAVALVSYRRVDRRALGGVEFPVRWRALDVFESRDGQWRLIRHTQTWLSAPVVPVALDSAAMQAFVGRYQIAPGYVDDVHWEGRHLVATATGFPPGARLVPVGASVFSPDGTGALIAFERDATGRVIGYVQGYPDGHIIRRQRLP